MTAKAPEAPDPGPVCVQSGVQANPIFHTLTSPEGRVLECNTSRPNTGVTICSCREVLYIWRGAIPGWDAER